MWKTIVLLLALTFAAEHLAAEPLPCDSFLRIVHPGLFSHCLKADKKIRCSYGEWSSWKYTGTFKTENCTAKEAFKEVRTRNDNNKVCKSETEARYTCKPTLDQRVQVFIEALDLGISTTPPTSQPATTDTPVTQPFTTKRPTTRPPTRPPTTRPGTRPPTTKPTTCITCYHNISYRAVTKRPTVTFRPSTRPQSVIVSQPLGGSLLGKRSINYCPSTGVVHKICSSGRQRKDYASLLSEFPVHNTNEILVLDSSVIPNPFDLDNYLSIIRNKQHRQRRMTKKCNDRYLLLMLDTSGSIGESKFKEVTAILSELLAYFCHNTKVAAVTFSSHTYHQFCFNCPASDNRYETLKAVKDIPYHGGATYTGEAVKCACEQILTKECGIPGKKKYQKCKPPIDVLMITDGHSNGPLNVCKEAKCLHNHDSYENINTFAIGVKNADKAELECIEGENSLFNHIFNMKNFDDLKDFLREVVKFLKGDASSGYDKIPPKQRQCFDANRPIILPNLNRKN